MPDIQSYHYSFTGKFDYMGDHMGDYMGEIIWTNMLICTAF